MADTTNLGLGGVQNPFLGQDNPYLTNAIDLASQDMVKNYNLSTQPAFNAGMVRSGSFGNSAINELNQNAQNQLQTNLGDLSSKMRFNDYNQQGQLFQNQQNFNEGQRQYNQNFGRTVFNDAFSQNQQNMQNSLGLLGTLNGYNTQDINNATTQQNAPMNYWQQFSQGANATGGQGGSTTATQGTTSNPLASALGGAQIGSSIGKSVGDWWNSTNWSPNTGTGSSDWVNGSGNYSQYNQPDYGQNF